MSLRMWICILILALSFSAAPAAQANDKSNVASDHSHFFRKRGEDMWKKIQEIYNQLDLTEDQRKLLEDNKSQSREQMKTSFGKKRSLRESLRQELMKPNLDMNKINDLQSQLKTNHSEMTDHRLNSILEVRKILSPEQFAKFLSLLEDYKRERFLEEK